jgi:hypothetical protein
MIMMREKDISRSCGEEREKMPLEPRRRRRSWRRVVFSIII